MKRVLALLLIAILALSLVACGGDEKAIEDVIKENLEAMEKEDVDAYMDTVHADSELFEMTRQSMITVFELYDLKVKIVEMEVIEIDGDEARVRVVQETRNENDEPFDDNKMTAVHTVVKVDGEWKITFSEVEKVDAL